MTIRLAPGLLTLLILVLGCRSAGTAGQESVTDPRGGSSLAAEAAAETAEPVPFVPPAPLEWTGAFAETAVLLASTLLIEGPAPLLEHVVASSDKELYERSVTTTSRGLVQVVTRRADSSREVRVQLDAWSLAAIDRIVIVETAAQGPVRVLAEGAVIWRDLNARLLEGEQLQFTGEIGDKTPFSPPPSDGGR